MILYYDENFSCIVFTTTYSIAKNIQRYYDHKNKSRQVKNRSIFFYTFSELNFKLY